MENYNEKRRRGKSWPRENASCTSINFLQVFLLLSSPVERENEMKENPNFSVSVWILIHFKRSTMCRRVGLEQKIKWKKLEKCYFSAEKRRRFAINGKFIEAVTPNPTLEAEIV